MILPSDKDYQETKQIMLGKKELKPEFRSLARWIDSTYGVKTINIYYDTIENGTRPRLKICFEHPREKTVFTGPNGFDFDRDKQKAIAKEFKKTLKEQGLIQSNRFLDLNKQTSKYKTDNLWVIYGDFESLARIETNQHITEEQIKTLKQEINNSDLWEISRVFSGVTFFLFTDEQVKMYKNSEVLKEWTDMYFQMLSLYDTFGYFKKEHFSIYLDSKENFDNNFESNWYYYYR